MARHVMNCPVWDSLWYPGLLASATVLDISANPTWEHASMARKAMARFDGNSAKDILKARKAYIGAGIKYMSIGDDGERKSLGYERESLVVAGVWYVRVEIGRVNGVQRRRRERLGLADDLAKADGVDVLSFAQARDKALAWQPTEQRQSGACTLAMAIEQYKTYRGVKKNKPKRNQKKAHSILVYHVIREEREPFLVKMGDDLLPLAEVAVNDLTKEMLIAWRDMLEEESSKSNASRVWANLYSCLERAYENPANGITSADAWRDVDCIPREKNARLVAYEMPQAVAIIDAVRAAGYRGEADYFEALAWTGARPGDELLALTVADFHEGLGKLHTLPRSEEVCAKTGDRPIPLHPGAFAFFKQLAGDRPKDAPLLARDDGTRWPRTYPFSKVLRAVGAPEGSVPYSFRHSYISDFAKREELHIIAKLCGTSEEQIKNTYWKLLPGVLQNIVDTNGPNLRG